MSLSNYTVNFDKRAIHSIGMRLQHFLNQHLIIYLPTIEGTIIFQSVLDVNVDIMINRGGQVNLVQNIKLKASPNIRFIAACCYKMEVTVIPAKKHLEKVQKGSMAGAFIQGIKYKIWVFKMPKQCLES